MMIEQDAVRGEALRRAAHLHSALEHLQAAVPARVEGCDASGRVRVVLGADGLPVEIRAAAGWAGLGEAVEEAFVAASASRLRTWQAGDAPTGPALPGPLTPEPAPGGARPVEQIAEDVIAALGEAVAIAQAPPAGRQGIGSAGAGRLVLLLSYEAGVRCSADPGWVSRQDGARLDHALAAALRDARRALAQTAPVPPRPWDALLAEASSGLFRKG